MSLRVGTIIARNYLPFARVLALSLARHHPDVRLAALVFDDRARTVDPADEPFDVLGIEDLDEAGELLAMAGLYDVTELATALKPWLLEHLLADGADAALYLDPDIEVFAPLEHLGELAAGHGVALTPHAVLPMPRDGRHTDETTILAAGVYNLGFIGVGRSALGADGGRPAFLDFWKDRLRRECVIAPLGMRFVDQRWIDFVPGIYEPAIVRDPTCNVAYWNLDGRVLTWDGPDGAGAEGAEGAARPPGGGTYRIDGRPLTFFHFSGYKPTSPHLLSTHQAEPPRILLSERPDLRRITGEYGALLVGAGYGVGDPPPYGFGTMANGVPVDAAVRKILRDLTAAADAGRGPAPPLPWSPEGAEELCALLRRPPPATGDPGRLSIYLATVFAQRVDELRPRFFDPQVVDRRAFLAWARAEAEAGRLSSALVPTGAGEGDEDELPPADSQWTPGDRLVDGAVVAADPLGSTGGLAALRSVVAGAREAGTATATFVAPAPGGDRPALLPGGDGRRDHRVAVVAAGAGGTGPPHHLAGAVGPGFFAARRVVVVADWPLTQAPRDWPVPFAPFEPAEVWATSDAGRRALTPVCDVPVLTLPFCFPDRGPFAVPSLHGEPEHRRHPRTPWTVGTHVDLRLPLELTNPLGLVRAFTSAFPPDGRARLVLTVVNAAGATAVVERLRLAAVDRSDVVVEVDQGVGDGTDGWLEDLDCVASLHRGEGTGWAVAAALATARPVVATASGVVVELAGDGAELVPFTEVVVPPTVPLPPGLTWAEPELEAAVLALRRCATDPDHAGRLAARGREVVLTRADPARRASFVGDRIRALDGSTAPGVGTGVPGSGTDPATSVSAGSRGRLGRMATRLGGRGR